jgi:RHS repeat-associated protein
MRVRCNPIVRPLCFLLFLLSAGIASAQLTGAASADAVSRLNAIRDDSYAGNRVDTSTGAFVMALPAISVQGGREVAVALRYNSLLTQNRGRLGFGWSHEYEAFIEGDPAGVVTVWWDANRRNTFRFAGSGNAYEPLDEAVRYDKLRREPNDSWHLTRFDGTVYEFEAIAMGGKLERLGNKVRQFLDMVYVDGRLREIRESIGNRFLTLHYRRDGSGLLDTIQDQLDRLVHFEYDSNARLASLRAPVSPGLAFGESFVPKDIPDNNSDGITHNIVVARAEPIGLVFLTASNISHQDPTQLRVLLTSPGGTTLQFTTNSTNPSWDFTDTVLAAFDGENPEGTWRVRVIDNVAGGTGRLNGWRMRFTNVTDETRFAYDGANRLAIARGPDDAILYRNWFDPQGRVMQQDDGRADNEVALFSYSENAAGATATYQDRAGAEWQFQHDAGHHLTSLRDPLNASTAYAYNSRGDRTQLTDALGRVTAFSYDSNGNLITVVDPRLNTSTLEYDDRNNLTRFRDALGKTSAFTYDSSNNLTNVKDALCQSKGCQGDQKTYSGNSQMQGNALAAGGQMGFGYGSQGLVTSADHPAGHSDAGADYDFIGRLLMSKDSDGFQTTFEYDDRGNVIAEKDPLGNTKRSVYDRRGRLAEETDRRGHRTRYEYDGNNNLVRMIDALGNVVEMSYDGEDRPVSISDPRGNSITKTYDAVGRLATETDALGNTVRYEYNAAGNEIARYDARGELIRSQEYDQRGLVIAEENALGDLTTMQYDEVRRLTLRRDALGRETRVQYDALDRPTQVTQGGRSAEQTYYDDDVIQRITNPLGHSVRFDYDPANRIDDINTQNSRVTEFEYNGRDMVTLERSPSHKEHRHEYDAAGRRTRTTRSGGGIIAPEVRYLYDANGNLTEVQTKAFADITPQTQSRRVYDVLDRVTTYTDAGGNTISYAYDPAGNLSQLTYPDGRRVSYTYDAANRLAQIRDWADRLTSYSYDADGRVTAIAFPNGASRRMEYDIAGRLARRRDLDGGDQTIIDYRYHYDAAGQVLVEQAMPARPPYTPTAAMMTYDQDNRLTSFNGQSVTVGDEGNMTRGPLGDSFADFTYDFNNNLIRAGDVNYNYDAEDHLVSFTTAMGTTRLTVNPTPVISQILAQQPPGGSSSRYVWGLGLVYEERGNSIRVYHYDYRGSTIAFTGANGQVQGRVDYGPWGEIASRSGDTDSLFLFHGMFGVLTGPNGLNYMRFRWYSPVAKRFLTEDVHFGSLDELSSLNRFAFAGGNPISRVDPKGEFWGLIGAAIGAVANVAAQAISDVVTGKFSGWETYAGAALGGAVQGFIIASCPTPPCIVGASVASEFAKRGVERGLKGEAFIKDEADALSFGIDVGISVLSGGKKAFSFGAEKLKRRVAIDLGNATLKQIRNKEIRRQLLSGLKKGFTKAAGKIVKACTIEGEEGCPRLASLVQGAAQSVSQFIQPSPGTSAGAGRDVVADGALQSVNRGRKGIYGEYIHWDLYLDLLDIAGRPAPNNPNNLLPTF